MGNAALLRQRPHPTQHYIQSGSRPSQLLARVHVLASHRLSTQCSLSLHSALQHFVALPRVVLSAELPALHNLRTLGQISFSAQTTTLILTDLQFVTDASIADSIRKMPALEHIDLRCVCLCCFNSISVSCSSFGAPLGSDTRGTIKVGEKTVRALQAGGHRLRSLNLGETAVHLSYLQPLLLVARQLTSLKLANLKLFVRPLQHASWWRESIFTDDVTTCSCPERSLACQASGCAR